MVMELDFSEMIPFVLSNIRKRGAIPMIYMMVNVAFLVLSIILASSTAPRVQLVGVISAWVLGLVTKLSCPQ